MVLLFPYLVRKSIEYYCIVPPMQFYSGTIMPLRSTFPKNKIEVITKEKLCVAPRKVQKTWLFPVIKVISLLDFTLIIFLLYRMYRQQSQVHFTCLCHCIHSHWLFLSQMHLGWAVSFLKHTGKWHPINNSNVWHRNIDKRKF